MKPTPLPVERIKSELEMDGGDVVWKTPGKSRRVGKRAGSVSANGISIRLDGRPIWAHRAAWILHTGEDPVDRRVTHIDGDRTNNAKDNLLVEGGDVDQRDYILNRSMSRAHHPTGLWRVTAFYKNAADAATVVRQCKDLVKPVFSLRDYAPDELEHHWEPDEIDDED